MHTRVHLINPSHVAFGVAVITPRWLYVLAAATGTEWGDPVIVDESLEHQGPADLLINLIDDKPAFFRRFARLVEIVTDDADDAARGRLKWQFYKSQGYTLRAHDLAKE